MGPFLVAQLSVLSWLLLGVLLQLTPTIGKQCPCQASDAKLSKDKLGDDSFIVGTGTNINCCKDILLGYHDPGASIQWSFNGKAYSEEWTSSLRTEFCGNETIWTDSGKYTDQGTYNCTITLTNGTSKTFSMKMTMQRNKNYHDVPKAAKSSPNLMAMIGDRVNFSCEAFVGNTDDQYSVSVWWMKYFHNHTHNHTTFVNNLPNVTVKNERQPGGSWGMIKGQLVISSVKKIHFGIYLCKIVNQHGAVLLNMSLTEGIPGEQARILRYKTTMVVVASLFGLLAVLLFGWWRWRRLLLLYCRHGTASSDGHQYDVFLVHGDSASRWVWSVLLPALEDSFGYTCFLPQRDMCGGSMIAESVLEALTSCRRVVVVMTPCLLDSPWATWATCSGIQAALTTRARILALVHKKQNFVSGSHNQNPLLSVLKVVRKIKVPEEFDWDVGEEESPLQLADTPTQKTDNQKTELKLIIPEVNVSTCEANSPPGSQRLSNMITGSNAASREDLECEKDKTTQVRGPLVFTVEDHGPQDPGSPSSVTPFILPSYCKPYGSSFNGSVCQSVGWCLQTVCIGNPEAYFWQTLRLHLGPPSLSRPKSTDN